MTADELRKWSEETDDEPARLMALSAADTIDLLSARVAELEEPMEKWTVIDRRDGHIIGACPLCGVSYSIGEYDDGDAAIAEGDGE